MWQYSNRAMFKIIKSRLNARCSVYCRPRILTYITRVNYKSQYMYERNRLVRGFFMA